MRREDIRNIAIIAHVDHGKTTLVDRLLQSSGEFRENQQVEDRVLDSGDQERERGITILAKNVAITYKDVKINVIDTPGHADFGGEVERVLRMADGALLIVDAFEGPMPQTRFVLELAIELGLTILVVINKIDRPGARPDEVLDQVFELMLELGATDDQLDFDVIYTSALNGYARLEPSDNNDNMYPLLDQILTSIAAPEIQADSSIAMQVVTVDHSNYLGRIAIGKLVSGTIKDGQSALVIKTDGTEKPFTVKQLFTFDGLGRTEVESAEAGDIVAVVGIEDADIGDVITSRENPVHLNPIQVEQPTMSVVFEASTSPLLGREGKIVGGRQLKERLLKEAESNISMKIEEIPGSTSMKVAGRGVLHLSVLMETLRREGFEFQVGRPQVLYKRDEQGKKLEPFETAVVETPSDYAGKIIEIFGTAGGEMKKMSQHEGYTHLEFSIPTRGIMGIRNKILNSSHGEALFFHSFAEYGPFRGDIGGRKVGSMVSMTTEKSVAYALDTLQERGTLFIGPGEDVYEGMIVGESSREGDLVVNVAKSKQLTNMRAAGSDKSILLTPPTQFTLEEALEYIEDDELVEITPKNIRLRKRLLTALERKKAQNKS